MGGCFKILWIVLWCAFAAQAADVVRLDVDQNETNPAAHVDVTHVSLSTDEERTATPLIQDTIHSLHQQAPTAHIQIVCGVSPAECAVLKTTLASEPIAFTEYRAPPAPVPLPSDWKFSLSIVRCVVNGVLVGVTLTTTHNSVTAGIVGGLVAAAWSTWSQLINTERLDWQASTSWWRVRTERQAGLTMQYAKRAAFSAGFAALMEGVSLVMGTAFDQALLIDFAQTVAESLVLQMPLDSINKILRDRADLRNPELAWRHRRVSGVAALLQSTLATFTITLNVMGLAAGSWISFSVAGVGYLSWAYIERHAIAEQIRRRLGYRPPDKIVDCKDGWRAIAPG